MKEQIEDIAKNFEGFKNTNFYYALMKLIDHGKKAGINESIVLYSKDTLKANSIERIATQIKMFNELESRINAICDYADENKEIKEKEGDLIKWQI